MNQRLFQGGNHIDSSIAEANASKQRGDALLKAGDYEGAIRNFDVAIRLDPNFGAAFSNRGLGHVFKEDYNLAIQDFDKAIQINPKDPGAYIGRGAAYRSSGDDDAAIKDLDRALNLNSNLGVAYAERGCANLSKGDYNLAIRDYDQAIRINSDDAHNYFLRGVARFYQGPISSSVPDFTKSGDLKPSDAYTVLWLYLAEARSGQKPQVAFSKIEKVDPKVWPAPLIAFFAGKIEKNALLEAAHNLQGKKGQDILCDTLFFAAERDVISGSLGQAASGFKEAENTCRPVSVQAAATRAEIQRMGASSGGVR